MWIAPTTNPASAARLGISIRTVEMHRAHALRKHGARPRSEVVRWALDETLLH